MLELTREQQTSIARLFESESLTDNLVDSDAKALLNWAQQQIIANTDGDLVRAAVSAANSSGQEGAQAILEQASAFLKQELASRSTSATTTADGSAPNVTAQTGSAGNMETAAASTPKLGATAATSPTTAKLESDGEIGQAGSLTAQANGAVSPTATAVSNAQADASTTPPQTSATSAPTKASRVKSKRSRKKIE